MRWIDVAGPPAVGKSAILDGLWPRKVDLDGNGIPHEWEAYRALALDLASRSNGADECRGIIEATMLRVATVSRLANAGTYVQHGLAQIGLELGWRLPAEDVESLTGLYEAMPIGAGVILMVADLATIQQRNRARARNFAGRAPAMLKTIDVARQALLRRQVRVLTVDTERPIAESRASVIDFAMAS